MLISSGDERDQARKQETVLGAHRPIVSQEIPLFKVYTTDGCEVPVYRGLAVKDTNALLIEEKKLAERFNWKQWRKADFRYNCHGLSLLSRHGYVGAIPFCEPLIKVPGFAAPIAEFDSNKDIFALLKNGGYKIKTAIINIENITPDDIKNNELVKLGDIVIYIEKREIRHTGIVFDIRSPAEIMVLSKFGSYGEFLHHYIKVPETYGNRVEFWSNRDF